MAPLHGMFLWQSVFMRFCSSLTGIIISIVYFRGSIIATPLLPTAPVASGQRLPLSGQSDRLDTEQSTGCHVDRRPMCLVVNGRH